MADWTYLLADLRTNTITAEIPLAGAKPGKKLGSSGGLSGSWALSSRWVGGDPYSLTRPARTALYALRDGRPWWGGIVWTSRYDSRTRQIQLGASDWWSYFDHRKILPLLGTDPAVNVVASLATTYTGVDQNQIARNLLALAQSHTGGSLGVVADGTDSGVLRDRTYTGYELTDVGDALTKLSQLDGGPDIMFDVSPTLDSQGRPVRIMRIGAPTLGQMGSPNVFESGGNILSYTWPSDGTRMTTRAFAVGDGMEIGQLIAVSEDTARYDDGWPLLETDTSYSTVSVASTLQSHADADQAAAKLPVVVPTLVVRGDGRNARGEVVGPAIGDYAPGDDARVVIQDGFFAVGIDTTMRIVGIDVDPGDGSIEEVTLSMNPLLDDVA